MGELSAKNHEKPPSRLELAGLLGGAALFATLAGTAAAYAYSKFGKTHEELENSIDGLIFTTGSIVATATACACWYLFHKKRELRKKLIVVDEVAKNS